MTGKEYKICVSGTTAQLTVEVNALLAEGWEVFGHPFVGTENLGSSNGAPQSFCQAMVRGAGVSVPETSVLVWGREAVAAPQPGVAAAAVAGEAPRPAKPAPKTPLWIPKPPRTRTPVSLRGIGMLLGSLIGGYLLLEILVFHSGYYARFLEPEGATGNFERVVYYETSRKPSGKKEVLVLGNSRMAEGFSAKLADQASQNDGFKFINAGVPGTGNRIWYYLIRDLDPHRNKYQAITIPMDNYSDDDDMEDYADRAGDVWMVVNRLRVGDFLPFTFSFTTWKSRFEVFRGLVLNGTVYQRDFQDFMEHPSERLFRVRSYRADGAGWAYDYGGIPHTLAGMSVDWAAKKAVYPPGMPEDDKHGWDDRLFHHYPKQIGRTGAFEVRWLGALVDLYKGSQTKIIVFQAPRSPFPNPVPLSHFPWHAIDELRKRPWVTILDEHKFDSLEKPEWFADHAHLNHDGRVQFSPMLAAAAKEVLAAGATR